MTLPDSIAEALESTSLLLDAVVREDLELCPALLEARAAAMARFEEAHRLASEGQRRSCSGVLNELSEADKTLQEASVLFRDRLGAEYRGLMSSGPSSGNAGYSASSGPACLDRKA